MKKALKTPLASWILDIIVTSKTGELSVSQITNILHDDNDTPSDAISMVPQTVASLVDEEKLKRVKIIKFVRTGTFVKHSNS